MKLSTHNLLMCNKKTCADSDKNFPLKITVEEAKEIQVDFNLEKTKIFYNKLDINALNSALIDLNLQKYDLLNITDDVKNSDEFWQFMHHVLFEYTINKGKLICQNCNREFPILRGIPDMVLQDDEI